MDRGASVLLRVGLMGITSIGLGACATSEGDSDATSSAAAPDVVCVTERQTGTHFSQRICRTRSQIEADRAAADETLRDIRDHQSLPAGESR